MVEEKKAERSVLYRLLTRREFLLLGAAAGYVVADFANFWLQHFLQQICHNSILVAEIKSESNQIIKDL
ncbi:MAG: hypothetical protein QXU95_03895 [Candidatus Bathyarchaeia archaeon]